MTQDIDQLTITDLENIKDIIETATSRGAFRADELFSVGAAYDRLKKFLTSVEQQVRESQAAATETTETEQGE